MVFNEDPHFIQVHITWNEFLPRVLGWNAVNLYELNLLSEGYYRGYDDSCNPTILNEFAAAAFRFGHSLLKPRFKRMADDFADGGPDLKLSDMFFNPDNLYEPGMMDDLIRGVMTTSMETLDQFITHEVTNHLFEDKHTPYSGLDLVSLNLQRARDHGIPGYNNYRAICNLTKAADFEGLRREVAPPVIERLKRTYAHVDDIDLFTGSIKGTVSRDFLLLYFMLKTLHLGHLFCKKNLKFKKCTNCVFSIYRHYLD